MSMFAYKLNKEKHVLEKKTIPIPEPAEFEVLFRTLASGVCHTGNYFLWKCHV
jgi:D-arabinose 1-dehydrogenase-like Zn-dependent alcohol dehydrogenase